MKYSLRVITASALLTLCGVLALSGCSGSIGFSASPPANTASAGAKAVGPVIINLRPAEEFKEGHPEEAVNYGFSSGDFSSQISGLDRSSQYQLCGSADRPKMAGAIMCNAGSSSVAGLGTLDATEKTTGVKIVADRGPSAQSPAVASSMVLTVSVK